MVRGWRLAGAAAVCAALCLIGPGDAGAGVSTDAGEELIWRLPLEQKLEKTISFSFESTPLEDVLDFLRNHLQLNLVLDRSVVAEDQKLVTFTANDLRGADALKWVMTLTGLEYGFRSGAIYVSTAAKVRAAEHKYLQVYDVRDLVQRASVGANGDDDDDDTSTDSTSTKSSAWLVQVIVALTGRENWRNVAIVGGGTDEDETTNGADMF